MNDPSHPLDAATARWIENKAIGDTQDSVTNSERYAVFMASIATIKEQAVQKSAMETALALAQRLGRDDLVQGLQTKIQAYQDDIDSARSRVLDYAADAIRAQEQASSTGGGSPDASGSGNSIVDGEQTAITEVDAIQAEAVRDGNAIARAYVDPTGLLNGANQTLTSAQLDAMAQRIRIAETATSATPTFAPANTGDFTSTAAVSPLTVTALNPIYKNYKVTVGPNGALVVSVPTLQVQTPTGVMTIPSNQVVVPSTQMNVTSTQINVPSTQVNVPSTQVNTPSTQVNVPSLQTNVPSTQVQTPSSVMTSPDLQPALCGR